MAAETEGILASATAKLSVDETLCKEQDQDGDPDAPLTRRSFVGNHGKGMLRTLNELRRQGLLCDATLMVENKPFPVHRCILAACSDYFCAMFTSEVSLRAWVWGGGRRDQIGLG